MDTRPMSPSEEGDVATKVLVWLMGKHGMTNQSNFNLFIPEIEKHSGVPADKIKEFANKLFTKTEFYRQ